MRFSIAFERLWPNTARLLREQLPGYAINPAAIAAFQTYGGLDAQGLKAALSIGTSPEIALMTSQRAHGRYLPGGRFTKDTIYLDTGTLQAFEKQPSNACFTEQVIATVLHELAHWADWRDGGDFPTPLPYRDEIEVGEEIERAVFGKVVACQIASANTR